MHTSKPPRGAEGAAIKTRRTALWALLTASLLAAALLWQWRQLLGAQLADTMTARLAGDGSTKTVHSLGRLGLLHGRAGSLGLGGGGGDSGSGGGRAPRDAAASCALDVAASQFADSCTLLRDVCVDQGTAILYREEDTLQLRQADGPGYELIEPLHSFAKFTYIYRSDGGADPRYRAPPIRLRPAAQAEGAGYLRDPSFSSCTVPILWYPFERLSNFAHVYRDNAAKLLGVLRGTPWARHAKLVLMTAEGLSAPDWNYALLQPLSPLKVETWADFSARLPGAEPAAAGGGGCVRGGWEGEDAGAAGAGLPLSSEGGPQRCFRHMYVCARGINITSWPLHGLGQHLVKHYGSLIKAAAAAGQAAPAAARAAAGEQQQQRQQGGDDREDEGSDSAGASGSSRPGGGDRVLRIVFHKRSTKDRQLLNAADLLDRCNRWQYTSRAGQRLRASCAEVQLMSLLSGMAAAQEADVFVGVHGANMANAWLMRPGSSMIELQPYGFDQGPAHLQYPLFNKMDNDTAVLWWLISVCDPKASTPGEQEARGVGTPSRWPRDRNLRVSWGALRRVLETVVEVDGDMREYRRRWEEGRWWWWLGRGGSMEHVGPGRATRMRCPKRAGTADAD